MSRRHHRGGDDEQQPDDEGNDAVADDEQLVVASATGRAGRLPADHRTISCRSRFCRLMTATRSPRDWASRSRRSSRYVYVMEPVPPVWRRAALAGTRVAVADPHR